MSRSKTQTQKPETKTKTKSPGELQAERARIQAEKAKQAAADAAKAKADAAKTKAAKPKAEPKPTELPICLCGCGGTTNAKGKSRFLAGHDARLKGNLQRIFRDEHRDGDFPIDHLVATWNERTAPVRDSVPALDPGADVAELAGAFGPMWVAKVLTDAPTRAAAAPRIQIRRVGDSILVGWSEGKDAGREFVWLTTEGYRRTVAWSGTEDAAEVPEKRAKAA